MLYPLPNPGRRRDLLTRAARAVGLRNLREDPRRFARLLEDTIGAHGRYFAPPAPADSLSMEEVRVLGARLEDLIDEAVLLALELYPGKTRDSVLLAIASHGERLMRRIWSDPWAAGAQVINAIGDRQATDACKALRKLELIRRSRADKET